MNTSYIYFFCIKIGLLILGLGQLSDASAQALVYENPTARQVMGGMFIEKVIISDSATVIKAFCINDTYKPSALISTSPPGSNDAFRLIAEQRYYQLTGVEGIPTGRENVVLPFGDTIYFELTFPVIPKSTKVIDLVEGASQVENAWMLYGVQLTNETFESQVSFEKYFEVNELRLWSMEGFWEVDARLTTKDEKIQTELINRKERVAIVREQNNFIIYNMKGEVLDIYFKHFRREKFVINFPFDSLYPIQRTFRYKIRFESSFRVTKRHLKLLGLDETFKNSKKVYFVSDWRFVGVKL